MKQDSTSLVDRTGDGPPLDEIPPPYSVAIDSDAVNQALDLGGLHTIPNFQEDFDPLTFLR